MKLKKNLLFCFSLPLLVSACSAINPFNYVEKAQLWEKDRQAAFENLKAQKPAEAVAAFQKVLTEAETFGMDDARVATSAQELADIYVQNKEYKQASALYQRSANIYQKLWDAMDKSSERIVGRGQDLASVLDKLADCYEKQNQIQLADAAYVRALKAARLDHSPAILYRKLTNDYKNFLARQNRMEEAHKLSDQLENIAPMQNLNQ